MSCDKRARRLDQINFIRVYMFLVELCLSASTYKSQIMSNLQYICGGTWIYIKTFIKFELSHYNFYLHSKRVQLRFITVTRFLSHTTLLHLTPCCFVFLHSSVMSFSFEIKGYDSIGSKSYSPLLIYWIKSHSLLILDWCYHILGQDLYKTQINVV